MGRSILLEKRLFGSVNILLIFTFRANYLNYNKSFKIVTRPESFSSWLARKCVNIIVSNMYTLVD